MNQSAHEVKTSSPKQTVNLTERLNVQTVTMKPCGDMSLVLVEILFFVQIFSLRLILITKGLLFILALPKILLKIFSNGEMLFIGDM